MAEDDVLNFMSITDAPKEVAKGYLDMAKGDLQEAINLFMENPEALPPQQGQASPKAKASAKASVSADSIDSIVRDARQAGEEDKGTGKGKGKGDGIVQNVAVFFLSDGFMIDDDAEAESDDEEEEVAAPKAAPRRTGMMSLSDLAPSRGKGGGKGKKLPKIPKFGPLRSYDTPENKKFLDDLNQGVVPDELRKIDEQGKPIGISFQICDMRPMPSTKLLETLEDLKKLHSQMDKEDGKNQSSAKAQPSTMFTGAGHTLSASSQSSTGQANASSTSGGGGSADPALVALVSGKAAPAVDESKPVTTLQLRLSTGARVKVRLNLDHTVADLWRVVAEHLGQTVFATSSGHELSAGFPPKPLRDTAATLQAADLANASVTHRCATGA
jgi:hypothetical protein